MPQQDRQYKGFTIYKASGYYIKGWCIKDEHLTYRQISKIFDDSYPTIKQAKAAIDAFLGIKIKE